jgi:thiamine-phosphate pyrophosphorylase
VAFGRFCPSSTNPHATQALPALLSQARTEIDLPIVAIGGLTPENGAALLDAGADLLAVIHGVFGQPDVRAAARAYSALFDIKN